MAVEQGTHRVEVYKSEPGITVYSTLKTDRQDGERQKVGDFSSINTGIKETRRGKIVNRIVETISLVSEAVPIGIVTINVADDAIRFFEGLRMADQNVLNELASILGLLVIVSVKQRARSERIKASNQLDTIIEASHTDEASIARTYPYKI